ncbi:MULTISPECIES: DNA adenine methylase [Clostridium]|uniref:DNA adenine methylase n=1 Tax=Clostridium TaxID=1485 RepID=UPI0030B9BE42
MMNFSPLRYPGGKSKIAPFIEVVIDNIGFENCTYIEPFAGGAGVALALLFNNKVQQIIINDYDKAIYSFWKAVINDTNKLLGLIKNTPISVEEWKKQKEIYSNKNDKYSVELGFATFYLNRTNRSGILKAGPIGGYNQEGNYLIDARYNKDILIKKIELIAARKNQIKIYNKEVRKFIEQILPQYGDEAFVYFDPPYFNKGKELYKNFFNPKDHAKISESISKNVNSHWIVTYDDFPEIVDLYKNYYIKRFDINYSVANNRKGSEIIIFKDKTYCPSNEYLVKKKIKLNLR